MLKAEKSLEPSSEEFSRVAVMKPSSASTSNLPKNAKGPWYQLSFQQPQTRGATKTKQLQLEESQYLTTAQETGTQILREASLTKTVSFRSGQLKQFVPVWKNLTNDKTIISWVDGYVISFARRSI